jgi:hypothetical protein
VTPTLEALTIRWGEQDSLGLDVRGYELRTTGELFAYRASGDSLRERVRIGRLDAQLYCTLLQQTLQAFRQVPAFHVPAAQQRFVEYVLPPVTPQARLCGTHATVRRQ